ncbi:hypothetical protein SAMN05421776_106100 [Nocardia farcinica]|uniref:LPXTG cell wall anchor domain-containing protein n=1 Tax=Nocardia farcinica TaxID=37329 RepID=A0A0H5P554_NOCFR|nr:hypothetical protein CJ469_03927 [Nocardia farcinica]PFX07520.1 hypothetical protein CJ468_03442 [Nocardia farcinica]CRY82638.1 Uncharacterised protein [Nocardia farcinica]SIT26193.1 hypothetical protein SAMN05421776_106100 [Nocardia farcinica]SUE32365.1 Uncharacterised protein [Nocardia farcinica]
MIIGIAVLVGAVILSRKAKGQRPNEPETPGNDGE